MEEQAFKGLRDFFSGFKKLSFRKGETILRPDDEPHGVFYLTKGYTRLYSISKNAQELTLVIYKPEDLFPVTWTINNTPNTYYLESLTNSELYRTPKEEFLKFLKNNNDIMLEISSRISERLEATLKRMEHAMFGNACSKVASIILICTEKFGDKQVPASREISILIPLTHQDIAKLIGMARETVSIEMKKLQRMELIDYRGKYLIIKDYQKLKNESVLGPLD